MIRILKIITLFIVILALAFEVCLRLFDPVGLLRLSATLHNLHSMIVPQSNTYVFIPGQYNLADNTLTVGTDGYRVIPDNHDSNCRIAILGDSVALGWGVNDEQAWVNLIARQMPNVKFINTAVFGYNIKDVYLAYQRVSADAYLYLMVSNDDEAGTDFWNDDLNTLPVAIIEYSNLLTVKPSERNPVMFNTYLEKLQSVKNMTIVGFKEDDLARTSSVLLINGYVHRISKVDAHANAEGNREIADALLPIVRNISCAPLTASN